MKTIPFCDLTVATLISDQGTRSRKSRRGAKAQQDQQVPCEILTNLMPIQSENHHEMMVKSQSLMVHQFLLRSEKKRCLMETMIIVDTEITKTNHMEAT